MQAVRRAYLLSQGLRRAQPEGLREHCDLHFSDTSCSCYFNCGLVAYSQGKEWISGQKADSILLSFQSLIPDMPSNHHITWKTHYKAQTCQPSGKTTWMKSNGTHLFISPFPVHYPLFSQLVLPFFYLPLFSWKFGELLQQLETHASFTQFSPGSYKSKSSLHPTA